MVWAPDYLQSQQLKNYLGIEDNADDVFIGWWITTVSRNVDDFCGRQFGQVDAAEDRYYPTFWDRDECAWFATLDDIQDITDLTFADGDGTVVDSDSWTLLPRNAAAKGRPYGQVRLASGAWSGGELTGNGLWGWSSAPSAVFTGMLLQAGRLNARRDSPFGIAGSPQEGGELKMLFADLDPDFRTSLKPLVRKWWAA